MRNTTLIRTLRLMRLLEAGDGTRWRWRDLAQHLDCSTRTVRRDVDALRDAGAEITQTVPECPGEAVWIGPLTWPTGRRRAA